LDASSDGSKSAIADKTTIRPFMIVGSSAVGRRVEQLTTDKVATVMEAKDHIAAAA